MRQERKKVISDEVLDKLIESTRQEPTIEQDSTSIEWGVLWKKINLMLALK